MLGDSDLSPHHGQPTVVAQVSHSCHCFLSSSTRHLQVQWQTLSRCCGVSGRWYDLQDGASCLLMEGPIQGPAGVPLSLAAGAGRLALGCSGGCIATMPITASLDPQVCTCARANNLPLWGTSLLAVRTVTCTAFL